MNLYQKLCNEIDNHKTFWNYYDSNFGEILGTERSAKDFICDYFKNGSKLYAASEWDSCSNEKLQIRNVHTVNVFFIGVMLQRMIDEGLAIKSESSSDYPFSYVWYLLCLAHDFGYVYENYSKAYLEIPNNREYYYRNIIPKQRGGRSRKIWYQDHGIDIAYTVPSFGNNVMGIGNRKLLYKNNNIIEYNNKTVVDKPRYPMEIKNNYFYYRLYKMNALDHGIIGADELFSKLVINYIKEYRVVASRNDFEGTFYEFYNDKRLYFSIEQFKIFAYIADCVAAHNMYMADITRIEIYKEYALDCLLPGIFKRISYKENPLLFILCVADTIEPSKKFSNYDNANLLKKLFVDYSVDSNILCVEIDTELYNSIEGKEYIRNIQKLEEWCEIETRVRECNL